MLTEKINEQIKLAMKSGDKLRLETLRSIRASIIEFEKSGLNRTMTEEDEIKILNSQAKKRKDAIEIYEKSNRQDLAEKEKNELKIISEFLPKQLSDEELVNELKNIILQVNAISQKDFGKVMSEAMKILKGKAEGKKIQELVKQLLPNG